MPLDLVLWKTLSKKSCLIFGEECASVIVWVMITLAIRTPLVLLKVENYVPRGFIFALPFLIQVLKFYLLICN
jgi:hypothetical protein